MENRNQQWREDHEREGRSYPSYDNPEQFGSRRYNQGGYQEHRANGAPSDYVAGNNPYEHWDDVYPSRQSYRPSYDSADRYRDDRARGYPAPDHGASNRSDEFAYAGEYGSEPGAKRYPSDVRGQYERTYDRYGNEFSRRQSGGRFSDARSQRAIGVGAGYSDRDYHGGYEEVQGWQPDFNIDDDFPRRQGVGADVGFADSGRSHRNDWQDEQAGQYSGKGPKGFQRSSESLKERVCERLESDGRVDASEIEVEVENCEVSLTGTVSDWRQKRRAEDCAASVRGIEDVHNRLAVDRGARHSSDSSDSNGGQRNQKAASRKNKKQAT